MGGTVRLLLHVEGIGRQVRSLHVCARSAFWLCFLQQSNERRPVAPFEREDLLLLLSWKINFFSSVFLSPH